ncbi:GTP-binding protein 10 [Armadillidium nasatum]|uniref:GTP-binding protein 10 n=1 Tax=Armadillidium nasatum TaxID=96803 RepID=A0A5N5T2Y9_9CRUS|nr:GTP-binding protein 10 [Armadillidium nasatum]
MSKTKYTRNLIDAIRLYVKAGSGGNGHPKFGGIGGRGGDVFVEGVKNQKLEKLKKPRGEKRQFAAESGKASQTHRIYGQNGEHLVIPAPLGTMVQTDLGLTLGDIIEEGEKILVARGGSGGNPDNNFFGQPGEKHHIQLLLKLIADIGLVGFPNAVTTLEPTVGMLKFDDSRMISMADLPGLIEGAWINKGMGHKFLRHVERTKLMLFVVDVEGFQLGPTYPRRSPIETVILLNKELELYQPELIEKPAALVFNKMDKINSKEELDALKDQLLNIKVSLN